MIVLGIDFAKVNWFMIVYIVGSIIGLVYGTNKVYATGQTRGVLFAIGALIVLVYFGLRWFGNRIRLPRNWPPVINMCPDYLTYVSSAPGCVDMLGVSRSSSGITKTKQSEVASIRKGNMQKLFEYTSEDVAAAKTVEDLKQICDRCRSAGVTWEGVWDGDTCVGISKYEKDANDKETCLVSV
jgi:hypothetical protein